MWNSDYFGSSFLTGQSPTDIAPLYYQGSMTYDEVVSECKYLYEDKRDFSMQDAFDGTDLMGVRAEGCTAYNWTFYEDAESSEIYSSISGHEVHSWVLVLCFE